MIWTKRDQIFKQQTFKTFHLSCVRTFFLHFVICICYNDIYKHFIWCPVFLINDLLKWLSMSLSHINCKLVHTVFTTSWNPDLAVILHSWWVSSLNNIEQQFTRNSNAWCSLNLFLIKIYHKLIGRASLSSRLWEGAQDQPSFSLLIQWLMGTVPL